MKWETDNFVNFLQHYKIIHFQNVLPLQSMTFPFFYFHFFSCLLWGGVVKLLHHWWHDDGTVCNPLAYTTDLQRQPTPTPTHYAGLFWPTWHNLELSEKRNLSWETTSKRFPVGKSVVHFHNRWLVWKCFSHGGQASLGKEEASKHRSLIVSTSFFASRFLSWVLALTSFSDGIWP